MFELLLVSIATVFWDDGPACEGQNSNIPSLHIHWLPVLVVSNNIEMLKTHLALLASLSRGQARAEAGSRCRERTAARRSPASNLPTKIIPTKVPWLNISGEFLPMGLGILPLEIKILLESNLLWNRES